MSQNIDTNVVEMRFDNREFEKNVKTSMSTIDKLKASLNFSGASKSFNQITEAANKVSFKGLEKSVDDLDNHISMKAAAMFTVVNNFVTQIQTSVANMIKQFTSVPVSTGFEEYELKMGSVQTIMAATGESLETINKYLEELNEYSDKTIYSFSDMTTNIGKFTNAGVKLEDAVIAMKGISNEAAISGANANEASRAMYNLAQSLSMGYVQYIDWKSIENANMATVEFKTNLAKTAEQLGIVKRTSEGYYSVAGKTFTLQQLFKDGMKEQWLTTDVLIDTLKDYADETTEIGKKAYASAQDVKTFTMMMDTLKEAAQSGWAYTWEIFIGDFEQAKKLFTEFSQIFGKMIDDAADARNTLLRSLLGSKWDQLTSYIEKAGISVEEFEGRLTRVLRDAGFPIDEMIKKWGSLGEAIKHIGNVKDYIVKVIKSFSKPIVETSEAVQDVTSKLGDFQNVVNQVIRGEFGSGKKRVEELTKAGWNYSQVQDLVNKVWERNGHTWKDTTITAKDLVEVMASLSDEEKKNLGFTEEQIEAYDLLMENIDDLDSNLNMILDNIYKPEGRELIFDTIKNIVVALVQRLDLLKEVWKEVFPSKPTEELYNVIYALNKFSKTLLLDENRSNLLRKTLRGLFSILGLVADVINTIAEILMPDFSKNTKTASKGILDVTAAIGDSIYNFRQFMKENGKLKEVILGAVDVVKELARRFGELPIVVKSINTIKNTIVSAFNACKQAVAGFFGELKPSMENLNDFDGVLGVINATLDKIKKSLDNIVNTHPGIKKVLDTVKEFFNKFKEIGTDVIDGFSDGIESGLDTIKETMTTFSNTVIDTVKDILGIHSPALTFFEMALMCCKGMALGFKYFTPSTLEEVKAFGKKVIDTVQGYIDKILKYIKNSKVFEKLSGYFGTGLEKLSDIFIWFIELMKKGVEYFKENVWNKEFRDSLFDFAKSILTILILLNTASTIKNVGKGIKNLGEGIKELGEGIGGYFKSLKRKNTLHMFRDFAIAVVGIIGILAFLSTQLNDAEVSRMWDMLGVVNDIMVIMGAMLTIMIAVNNFSYPKTWLNDSLAHLGKFLESIGITIISIAASFALVVGAMYVLKQMSPSDIEQSLGTVFTILNVLGAFAVAFGFLSLLGRGTNLIGPAFAILAMGIGVKLIVDIINKYFYTKGDDGLLSFNEAKSAELMSAFSSLFWIVLTIAGAIAAISIVAAHGTSYLGMAVAFIALASALHMIVWAIYVLDDVLSNLKNAEATFWMMGVIITAMTGVLLLLMRFGQRLNPSTIKNIGRAILAFAASLWLIANSIAMLSDVYVDRDTMVWFSVLAGIMAVMAVIMTVAANDIKPGTVINGRNNLMGVAAVLLAISASLWILTKIIHDYDLSEVLKAVGILGGIMLALALLMAGYSSLGKATSASAWTLVAMAVAIGVLAGAIYALQKVDIDRIVMTAAALGGIIAVMEWAAGLISASWELVGVLVAIGVSIALVAGSIYALSNVPFDKLIIGLFGVVAAAATVVLATLAFLAVASSIAPVTYPAVLALVAIAVAVAAIIIAVVELIEHKDDIKAFFTQIVDSIKEAIDWIVDLYNNIRTLGGLFPENPYFSEMEKKQKEIEQDLKDRKNGTGKYAPIDLEEYEKIRESVLAPPSTEPEYTEKTVAGNETKRYAAAVTKEAKVLKREAFETGEEVAETIGDTVVNSDTNKEAAYQWGQVFMGWIQQSTEQYAKYGGGFNLSATSNAIANNLRDSSQGIFGEYGGEMIMESILGMAEAYKNGDYSSLPIALGEGLDGSGLESFFKVFGTDMGDLTKDGFMTSMEGMNPKDILNMLYGKYSEASTSAISSYWDPTIGPNGAVIPVYSAAQASAVSPSSLDLTSLLGSNAFGSLGQTVVQFPDTMNTTSPDVVTAIGGLKQDIQTLGIKIANLYVKLDTGALVGQLTPEINQTMGRMTVYRARGN